MLCSCVKEKGGGEKGVNINDCLFIFFYWLPTPFEGICLFSSDFFSFPFPFLSFLFSFPLASLHGKNGVFFFFTFN